MGRPGGVQWGAPGRERVAPERVFAEMGLKGEREGGGGKYKQLIDTWFLDHAEQGLYVFKVKIPGVFQFFTTID